MEPTSKKVLPVKAKIFSPSAEQIERAAKALQQGNVVGMPTETVYGLAGLAFQETALLKIFSVKERPTFDPLIVHVAEPHSSLCMLKYLENLNLISLASFSSLACQRAETLLQSFWPGPLTLVLPKHIAVPDLVTSGLQTVAIRMPKHPVAQALLKAVGSPLAAPSANRFGHLSPTTAAHVYQELGDKIDIILEGGRCTIGLESTVVLLSAEGDLTLLRPGGTDQKAIEEVMRAPLKVVEQNKFQSPGLLDRHYAPQKPLYLFTEEQEGEQESFFLNPLPNSLPNLLKDSLTHPVGVLFFSEASLSFTTLLKNSPGKHVSVRTLSPKGDLQEAARRFFSLLRELDTSEAEILFAEVCPLHEGLGYAINDRLKRASAPKSV